MAISITISGTVIQFPSTGDSPTWSPAVIQFAEAVADTLQSIAGPFDVTPQSYSMVSNANTNVAVPNLSFPTSNVRGAFIRYAVYRSSDSVFLAEAGDITVVYNPQGTTSNKWETIQRKVGDAQISFVVTDVGQVTFSSTSISGIGPTGTITYTAQALEQS